MLDDLITGLSILSSYGDGPIVSFPYGLTVPRIKAASMSAQDKTDIETAGWTVHPFYESYWYEVDTLTELADITGPPEVRIPIFEAPTGG